MNGSDLYGPPEKGVVGEDGVVQLGVWGVFHMPKPHRSS
jgi:hypothetical protein